MSENESLIFLTSRKLSGGLSSYSISSLETYANIIDIGIATSSGKFYVWFADNRMSVGTESNLNNFIALKSMD